MTNKLLIANWKMFLTYNQEQVLLQQLTALPSLSNLVICPSLVSLASFKQLTLGAQNCSQYSEGAYTGEVAAQSLKEVGCSYCIIGHSERRNYFNETDATVVLKAQQLLSVGITPIICIGETAEDKNNGSTNTTLTHQMKALALLDLSKCIIAYEPVWAIGNGTTPTHDEIKSIIMHLKELTDSRILYGGSVHPTNIHELARLPLDGFLVGKASTDFNNLKKMVELLHK